MVNGSIFDKFPSSLNLQQGTNNYALNLTLQQTFETFLEQLPKLKDAIFITTAEGEELDDIGKLFNLTRDGQNDEDFRNEILNFWSSINEVVTKPNIKRALSTLLDIEESDISLQEKETLIVLLDIYLSLSDLSKTNVKNISKLVNNIKGAGIKFFINLEAQNIDYLESLLDNVEFDDTSNKIYANGHKAGDENVT